MPVHSIVLLFFFFNDTATTEIYTLSLHDALPIYSHGVGRHRPLPGGEVPRQRLAPQRASSTGGGLPMAPLLRDRSEEHTSELQSPCNLVCRLLLEKKKIKHQTRTTELTSRSK